MDHNEVNAYEGVLETWKVDLIVARARRKGLSSDRIQDVQQDIVLTVMTFQYDPANHNGASESTALTALIDRQICRILRGEIRARKRESRAAELVRSGQFRNREEVPATTAEDHLSRLAVREILLTLDEQSQALCNLIVRGCSQAEMAEQLGVSERTVRNLLARLRECFEQEGF